MRFKMYSFGKKNPQFFSLAYISRGGGQWGVFVTFFSWGCFTNSDGHKKTQASPRASPLDGSLGESWRQVLSPVSRSHLQSDLFSPEPTAAVKSQCSRWRVEGRGSTDNVTHEKHGKVSFPVFPSACACLWSGFSWMLFQETSGGLGQLVARETEAHSSGPLENKGRGETS